MANLSFGSSVSDAKERYNISFFILAVTVPVVVRYWDVIDPDIPKFMYKSDGVIRMEYEIVRM